MVCAPAAGCGVRGVSGFAGVSAGVAEVVCVVAEVVEEVVEFAFEGVEE
jgi:hypothetical protein